MDFVTVQIYKEGEYLGSDTGGTTALVRLVVIDRRTSIRVRNLRTRWLRRLKPKTTTHNAQRTGVRGRRKLRHPAPPPAPLPIPPQSLKFDTAFLCATDDTTTDDDHHHHRHRRRRPTTDDDVQRFRTAAWERYGGVSWEVEKRKEQDVVVVGGWGFR